MTDRNATPGTPPIVCDMTAAPDTEPERRAEYERLFTERLAGRERTADGIRFRFRAEPGTEEQVRDLAAREKACCPFFTFDVTVQGDEIWWDATVADDETAHRVLDELYRLPDTVPTDEATLRARFEAQGLTVVDGDDRPAPS